MIIVMSLLRDVIESDGGGAYVSFFANLQAVHVILHPIIRVRIEVHQDGSGCWLFVCGQLELYSNNAWVPAHTGQESKTLED